MSEKRKKYGCLIMIIKLLFWIALFIFIGRMIVDELRGWGWHRTKDIPRTSKIYSLKTQSNTEGSFILGVGAISGNDYYVFYRETSSGGLIREKINTSNCILYEGVKTPKVVEYGTVSYYLQDGDTTEIKYSRDNYSEFLHEIYIPSGTITERIENFKLD